MTDENFTFVAVHTVDLSSGEDAVNFFKAIEDLDFLFDADKDFVISSKSNSGDGITAS